MQRTYSGGPRRELSGRSAVSKALPRVARALGAVSLTALGIFLSTAFGSGAELAQAALRPPDPERDRLRELEAGQPAERVGRQGGGDPNIQGFATDISVDQGQTRPLQDRHHRLGLSPRHLPDGLLRGRRRPQGRHRHTLGPAAEPAPLHQRRNHRADRLRQLGGVRVLGSAGRRGLGHLLRQARPRRRTSDGSHIIFIVRDDGSHSDLLFQTSDTTWQAYNQYGGRSLYQRRRARDDRTRLQGQLQPAAHDPGCRRRRTPLQRRVPDGPLARAQRLRRQLLHRGRHARRERVLKHKTYLSVGHDEYWSGAQRANVEAARAAGVNLVFFAGNEIFWKTRWEPASPAARPPTIEPSSLTRRPTPTPRSTRIAGAGRAPGAIPASARRPRWASGERADRHDLHGQLQHLRDRRAGGRRQDADLAQHHPRLPGPGPDRHPADGTLGYESDEDPDNGSAPAGLIRFPRPRGRRPGPQDFGTTYGPARQPTT